MKAHLVALLALLTVAGCPSSADEPAHAAAAPQVRTAPVEATAYVPVVEVTGSAEPIAAVQLGFDVPGRLRELLVARGATVRKGQALARLDASMAEAQLAQAEAGFTAATAQARAAEDGWRRVEKLGDGLSAQQRSEAEAGLEGARAQLAQAEAAVRLARTQLAWHTLRSPIDGVVTNGPDNAGMLVGAGTPLFVIEDVSALRLKGSVPEAHGWVTEGMAASVVSGTGAERVQGVVERVLPSLDPSTRRIPVEIRVDDPPPGLRSHAFVRATIEGAEAEALAVPKGALVARPDFAVLRTTAGGSVEKVPVTVLAEESTRVLVAATGPIPLAAGELVAVDPPHGWGD